AELGDGVAHRGEVHHAGHAGEVLHQHARGAILDFLAGDGIALPVGDRLDVADRNGEAGILEAQQVLEQDLHAEGQAADVADLLRGFLERVVGVGFATHVHRATGIERVLADLGHGGTGLLRFWNRPGWAGFAEAIARSGALGQGAREAGYESWPSVTPPGGRSRSTSSRWPGRSPLRPHSARRRGRSGT